MKLTPQQMILISNALFEKAHADREAADGLEPQTELARQMAVTLRKQSQMADDLAEVFLNSTVAEVTS